VDRIVIVGAGQAGIGAAAELRRRGFAGGIIVVGDEAHAPYQRPPLSKELLGGGRPSSLFLYPDKFYADQSIELRLGRPALAIDRQRQRLEFENGEPLAYDHLLIATGSRPRPLLLPGLEHAVTLRTLDEAENLAVRCGEWRRVAVVGGGFIGLELAAFLRSRDIAVTVLEAAGQLMGRVVSPATAAYFLAFHTGLGSQVRLGATLLSAAASGSGWHLALSDGTALDADAVIAAVGALPNDELAAACGLVVDRGIVVDEMMTSSDPAISAIGDCAVHPDPVSGRPVRLESVQNAVDQGKTFASGIVGPPAPYRSVPWFWSTQGSARLQIAGLARPGTEDIRRPTGSPDRLSVFRFEADRLAAVETVNQPGDHMLARRLLAAGTPVPKAAVADPTFDLRSLL